MTSACMTLPGRRQTGRFVQARIGTAFGIDRSIGGMLVLDSFATHCSVFVPGISEVVLETPRVRSASLVFVRARKNRQNTAIEKIRESLSKKRTGPERKCEACRGLERRCRN